MTTRPQPPSCVGAGSTGTRTTIAPGRRAVIHRTHFPSRPERPPLCAHTPACYRRPVGRFAFKTVRRGLLVAVVLTCWSTTGKTIAEEALTERVFIDYVAPASCPPKAAFLANMRGRTTRFELAEAGERARQFVVELRDAAPGAAGRVRVVDPDGSEREREVNGASCAEVADVLSFVVALAIDPHARLTAEYAVAPEGPARSDAVSPASTDAPPPARPTTTTPTSSVPSRWSWALGAGVDASSGTTPDVLTGPLVFGEASHPGNAWYAPILRVDLERTPTDTTRIPGGTAGYAVTFGRINSCILGLRRGWLTVSPCLEIEVGAIDAASAGLDRTHRGTEPWFALGPAINARLVFSAPFFVEVRAVVRGAVTREHFYIDPHDVVFNASAAGVGGETGLGVAFCI